MGWAVTQIYLQAPAAPLIYSAPEYSPQNTSAGVR